MNPRNIVNLIGYYPDPEKMGKGITYKSSEGDKKSYYRGKVSVRRGFKDKNGNYKYDFISIKCFGHNADYINNYAKNGDILALQGEIQVDDNYEDKEGNTVYGQPFVLVDSVNILSTGDNSSSDKSVEKNKKPNAMSALEKLRQKRNVVAS